MLNPNLRHLILLLLLFIQRAFYGVAFQIKYAQQKYEKELANETNNNETNKEIDNACACVNV